jgi:hypothetical protein
LRLGFDVKSEKIKEFSAAGLELKIILKQKGLYQKRLWLTVKILLSPHELDSIQTILARVLVKMQKYVESNSSKSYCFLRLSKLKVKILPKFRPYFYSTHSGIFRKLRQQKEVVMEGAAIIKLADLSSLWLETQVNVNYAKSLKNGQSAKLSLQIIRIPM